MSSVPFQNPTLTHDRNQEATIYIGNLDSKANEDILLELFIQCGPIVSIHIPKDKITNEHSGFGFLEFRNEDDCEYAIKIMNQIKLFGKQLKLNKASQDKRSQETGANLFIGNLSDEVDERTLRDVFSSFGNIVLIRIEKDNDGKAKHYGFINYDKFESSDNAIKVMNNQFLCGKMLKVEYAYREGSKTEKHGSLAERILAANKPFVNYNNYGNFSGKNNVDGNKNTGIFPVLPKEDDTTQNKEIKNVGSNNNANAVNMINMRINMNIRNNSNINNNMGNINTFNNFPINNTFNPNIPNNINIANNNNGINNLNNMKFPVFPNIPNQ